MRLPALIAGLIFAPVLSAQSGVGKFSINGIGAPTYGHSISVPPGIAGMEPKLSLYYSGSSANGPLGVGWSIQGVSLLSRCGAVPAIDGKRSAVGYVPTDKLCLDGNRLIQVDATGSPLPLASQVNDASGPAAGVYTEYRTETDQYARIRAYGMAGGNAANGPAYFLVWTKSGQIYEYGNTTDSQILAQGKTAVMVWAVDKISDTLGNYIAFKYTVNQNALWGSGTSTTSPNPRPGTEWNLAEVWYTGTASQAPTNKVVFTYATRTDNSEAYQVGSKNVSTKLLHAINTYVNAPAVLGSTGVGAKSLQLTYGSGWSGRNRVTQIAECSGQTAGKCLPPTTFTYRDSTATTAPDVYSQNLKYNLSSTQMKDPTGVNGIMLGDFNGDGRMDIIRWGNNPANNQLWTSNGDGTFSKAAAFNITTKNLFRNDDCYHSIVADFNGDGVADILRFAGSSSIPGTTCPADQNILYLGDPKGSGAFTSVPIPSSIPLNRTALNLTTSCVQHEPGAPSQCLRWQLIWSPAATFYVLDLNGDGILDLITSNIPAGSAFSWDPPSAAPCSGVVCTQVFLGSAPSPGNFAFISTPTNLASVDIYTNPSPYFPHPLPINLDFNGDGYADLLAVGSIVSTPTWNNWLSNGDGNFTSIGNFPWLIVASNMIDANGDGKIDGFVPGAGTGAQLLVFDGTQFQATPNFNLNGVGFETATASPSSIGTQIADVNGDGRGDVIRWEDSKANNAVFLSNGDGTFRKSTTTNLSAYQLENSTYVNDFVVADFTGHGNAEILLLNAVSSTSFGSSLLVKTDPTPADQLVSVTSPNGAVTTLTMVPLSNSLDAAGVAHYTSDRAATNAAVYPRVDMSLPLWSVATQTEDSGVGSSTVQINYSYFGLKADLTGRGLLGFRQINKTAPGADGTALTDSAQYLQTQPYIGVAASTQTTRVSDGLALKKTTNQYCDTTATNQTTFPCPLASLVQRPYLQQSVQTGSNLDRSPLPTVTTTNVINSTGDPTNVTVTTAASVAGVSETYTKTVANTYKPADTSGNNWILGRLSDTQVTNAVSPKPTGLIAASPGSAANASATSGTTTPLTAAASPASVTATATSQSGTVSGTTTLTIGGYPTPPLAYAFTRTSSSTNTQQITASGGPLVTFSANAANLVGQTATETFQISVTDAVGRAGSVNVTASLSGSAAVSVTSANFSPTTVTSGGTSTFSWSTLNATSASVSCTGAASGSGSGTSGSITVATSGAGTGTCTVTATNSANQSAQLSGTVSVVAAPSVASASFSPATVNSGATSTFSWNALNATSIAVGCVAPASGSYSGSSATGSITVSTSGTGTGSCTVTATNAAGTQATGSANLTVSPAFSVTFNPPSGSRTLSITNDLATPCGGESGDSVQFTVVGTGNLSASTSNSTYAVASPTSGTFSNTTSAVNFNTAFTGIGTYTWTATITVGTAHATYNGTTTVRKTSCGAPPQ